MLGNHKHQGEIVHSKRNIEELVRIHKEYNILDSVLHQLWVTIYIAS